MGGEEDCISRSLVGVWPEYVAADGSGPLMVVVHELGLGEEVAPFLADTS